MIDPDLFRDAIQSAADADPRLEKMGVWNPRVADARSAANFIRKLGTFLEDMPEGSTREEMITALKEVGEK